MKFMTTLNQIRAQSPCSEGWSKLLGTLGKSKADDEPLSLLTILDSNGLDDALWFAKCFEGHDRDFRLFAVWAARQVQHLMTDERSLNALTVAEQFANGEASSAQLSDARDASLAASRDASQDAFWDASREASRDASWAASRAASWDAAWAAWAAWDARAASRDALAKQESRLRQMIEEGGWVGSTHP